VGEVRVGCDVQRRVNIIDCSCSSNTQIAVNTVSVVMWLCLSSSSQEIVVAPSKWRRTTHPAAKIFNGGFFWAKMASKYIVC
jgi:hypothetical protein